MDKINVKPSKPASAAGIIVTIFLLIFGAGFLVLVGKVLSENEAPVMLSVVFYLFMLAWFVTGFFILIYHVLNLKKKKDCLCLILKQNQELTQRITKTIQWRDCACLKNLKITG